MNNGLNVMNAQFLYLSAEHPNDYFNEFKKKINKNTGKGICSNYIFKNTFFSDNNVAIIQSMIKERIKKNTCGKYSVVNQNERHLREIMEYVYDNYAMALPYKQKQQMLDLDNKVTDLAAETLMINIQQKGVYLRTKFNPLQIILPEPINDSTKGTKLNKPYFDEEEMNRIFTIEPNEDSIYNKKIMILGNNNIYK